MPTWEEIQQHARSKFTLQDDEDGYFGLVFGYDSGRSHKIFVRRFEAFDMDWLEFRATVCKGSEMAHAVALRKNLNFSVGAPGPRWRRRLRADPQRAPGHHGHGGIRAPFEHRGPHSGRAGTAVRR